MDIERVNGVLNKAIMGLQSAEIGVMADRLSEESVFKAITKKEATVLAKELAKWLDKPPGRWQPREFGGEHKWVVEPRDGGVFISLDIRGTRSGDDGGARRTIPVLKTPEGKYRIGDDRPKVVSKRELVSGVWNWWHWSTDD